MNETRQQWVTFVVSGDEFAILAEHISEVSPYGPVTRVPGAPAFVVGATSVRARPIPVIDLARKFGFEPAPVTRWTCLLLVCVRCGDETTTLACVVDEVRELLDVSPQEIEPPPPLGTRVHPSYLVGLVRSSERFVVLLDVQQVLSREELASAATSLEPIPRLSPQPPEKQE
jgi:purine-binding chemotaxis protein CheW